MLSLRGAVVTKQSLERSLRRKNGLAMTKTMELLVFYLKVFGVCV